MATVARTISAERRVINSGINSFSDRNIIIIANISGEFTRYKKRVKRDK